jgi:deoxyinosine 3'endonuclease (endonuclease V)
LNNADKIDDNILASLSQISNGIAIPMKGCAVGNDSREILAYALVGHGGRKNTTKISTHKSHAATESAQGSKNPIYISVGSHISLTDAVILCAEVCITRIPEPIREADLYGRKLVREMCRSMR